METTVKLRQKSVGISFAGGGAKSFAELATVEALKDKNIKISAVTGTSMGAFLAAGLAYGLSVGELEQLIIKTDAALDESDLFRKRSMWVNLLMVNQSTGLVDSQRLADTVKPLHELYQGVMLSDLPMPIAIPTVDIISGKILVFTNRKEYFARQRDGIQWEFYEGDVSVLEACLASSAYPLMIQPVNVDDYQLIDGGVLMNSPVVLFDRSQTEFVISIGIKRKTYEEPAVKSNEVALRAMNFMMSQQIDHAIRTADVILRFELTHSTFSFGHAEEIIAEGRHFMSQYPLNLSQLYEKEVIEPKTHAKSGEFVRLTDRMKNWLRGVTD